MTEPDIRPVDEGVDQAHRELVDLLDDRLGLADEIGVRHRKRDRGEQAEARGVERDRDTRRESPRSLRRAASATDWKASRRPKIVPSRPSSVATFASIGRYCSRRVRRGMHGERGRVGDVLQIGLIAAPAAQNEQSHVGQRGVRLRAELDRVLRLPGADELDDRSMKARPLIFERMTIV